MENNVENGGKSGDDLGNVENERLLRVFLR